MSGRLPLHAIAEAPSTAAVAGVDRVDGYRVGAARTTQPGEIDGLARDLRLDACRGLALWSLFVDHIPHNIVSWLTLRNCGFSDATEVFVFVSGYFCMVAYGDVLRRQGWLTRGRAPSMGRNYLWFRQELSAPGQARRYRGRALYACPSVQARPARAQIPANPSRPKS